jgi:hypothetical protein
MTQQDARARVARGAALLDEKRPGWERRIDLGTLTLHDPCGCIVGQLCGTGIWFGEGLEMLGIDEGTPYGLDLSHREVAGANDECARREAYRPLQDAWIKLIADRLVPTVDQGTSVDARLTPMDPQQAIGSATDLSSVLATREHRG